MNERTTPRVSRYSNEHEHVFVLKNGEWKFAACRMTGDMDICTGYRGSFPASMEFDGTTELTDEESIFFEFG
jgi:hypothetical protein